MTRKTKQFLRTLAEYYELRIKYVSDLPAKVAGFVDPSKASRTIVVNANRSKSDHAFTIAHEIAHFILHYERSHRMPSPWYLTRRWKSGPMIRFSKLLKRVVSRKLNDERQADMWAIAALLYIGARDDLEVFLAEHPDKTGFFCLCVFASIYARIKLCSKRVMRRLFQPFSV
jgi:hypothetical protein